MRVTFLGTGTSHGVPMIGCDCVVCRSNNPKNKRTRCSVYIETEYACLLIDTPPDLRSQLLREDVRRIDSILFTHAHADHLFGLDDIRRFNDLTGANMPCHGLEETLDSIRRSFRYVFVTTQIGGGKPALDLLPVTGPFSAAGIVVMPVKVLHGKLDVLGYRIGDFAYVTDVSEIPPASLKLLTGLEVLALGVLRLKPHETHFSLDQGLEMVDYLNPKRAYFTHIGHNLEHETINSRLPDNIRLAYDGLKILI